MSASHHSLAPPLALDEACFVARRVLAMIADPRTSAERLGRVIDSVEPLSSVLLRTANDVFRDRGRVHTSAQAITVIGFNRLETLTRRFLWEEFSRFSAGAAAGGARAPSETPEKLAFEATLTPAPLDIPTFTQVDEARPGMRYAAMG